MVASAAVAKGSKGTAQVTLVGDTEILITREFNAPRHLVYKAWTTPELIKRWWHARRGSVTSADVDLRVGGQWRWVMLAHGEFEVAFRGEYREIVPNEKLVFTEIFEGFPEGAALTSITFKEKNGKTLVEILVQHEKREHRDAHINSGMEAGMQDALDLLEELAISLQ